MRMSIILMLVGMIGAAMPGFAQPQVAPENRYERVLAVVPMVGEGSYQDPRRPMFAPVAGAGAERASQGLEILEFTYQLSDDGKFALVEFVALHNKKLESVLNASEKNVTAFRRGRATKAEIEAEFRKHKRDFDWNAFSRAGGGR